MLACLLILFDHMIVYINKYIEELWDFAAKKKNIKIK